MADPPYKSVKVPDRFASVPGRTTTTAQSFYKAAASKLGELEFDFRAWLKNTLIDMARAAAPLGNSDEETRAAIRKLQDIAHEIKGTASSYERPGVSDVAASLFDLCDRLADTVPAGDVLKLLQLHVSTLQLVSEQPALATVARSPVVINLEKAVAKLVGPAL